MGPKVLACPLCCGDVFPNRTALRSHLTEATHGLQCPACELALPSLWELLQHLETEECGHDESTSPDPFPTPIQAQVSTESEMMSNQPMQVIARKEGFTGLIKLEDAKQESHSKELAFVDADNNPLKILEDDENHILIVGNDSGNLLGNQSIITTQNEDGTISFTRVETADREGRLSPAEEVDADGVADEGEGEGEVYSCNTCGVSFTSVLQHIQTYHSEQEVVVEVAESESDTLGEEMPASCTKRVITASGDIVETTTNANVGQGAGSVVEECIDKEGRIYTRRYVRIEKFWSDRNTSETAVNTRDINEYLEFDSQRGCFVKHFSCGRCLMKSKSRDELDGHVCKSDDNRDLVDLSPQKLKLQRVCDRHFLPEHFYSSDKRRLLPNAVPTAASVLLQPVSTEGEQQIDFTVSAAAVASRKRLFSPEPSMPPSTSESTQDLLRIKRMKREQTDTGLYICPQCPVTYSNAKSLCAHMKVHKATNNQVPNGVTMSHDAASEKPPLLMSFKCDDCDTDFPSNKSLRLHRRMHEPVKSRPMEGPTGYNGAKKAAGGNDTYHCAVCNKWIHEGYRRIHNEFHNTSESEQHHCEICNRKFLSHEYLLMHMNVHSQDKTSMGKSDKSLPYSCVYCKRRFARPHEKVKHERIHTGEKPHSCEICGKSFRVAYCLTLHMRTHTGARPYECTHCCKRFKAHSVYNHHLLTHSEVRAYKCPFCPKAFKTSVQLAGHKNSHTKPFSCTQCNRPFASLYAVRVHTETHQRQNNLKFSCKLCGASYARAFALKDHVRSVHEAAAAPTAPTAGAPATTEYGDGMQDTMSETDAALAILPKKENDPLETEDLAD